MLYLKSNYTCLGGRYYFYSILENNECDESEKPGMRAIPAGNNAMSAVNQAEAAVSIIRCAAPADSILVLRRKQTSGDPWSGHFAFPGGRRDPGDSSILHTCLRETHEETGVRLDESLLTLQLPVTKAGRNVKAPILVQPYLFALPERPEIIVETAEIAGYLWLEVEKFIDTARHLRKEVLPSQFSAVYPLDDYFLWGFTYKLLCSVLEFHIEL